MLLLLLACAQPDDAEPLGERDVHRIEAGAWSLAEGAALRQGEAGLQLEQDGMVVPLAVAVIWVPAVAADGRRAVFAHRDDGLTVSALDVLTLTDDGLQRHRLVSDGSPDRATITEDGEWVAYVSGQTGIASVWVVAAAGGAPQQLTNVGLQHAPRQPGMPPAGFVPPPHDGPLRIEGAHIVWDSPTGRQSVALP